MSFTMQLITSLERLEPDTYGTGARTASYRTAVVRATGCDRVAMPALTLSAGLSAVSLALAPMGADSAVASNAVLLFLADHPVDLRLNAEANAPVSAVRFLALAATVSSLFVTTGSHATMILCELAGGSNAALHVTLPFA